MKNKVLLEIQKELNYQETQRLSQLATLNTESIRRCKEEIQGHRQSFALDADRIMHSKAYTRYIDKTQVFSLINNDHITHRVLHVQMVSRIGRTIGRFLGLNEDLIEAISLGHDIGHPPFGHEGEIILSKLCKRHGLDSFQHNVQSIQFLDRFEKKGKGWNLSLQVLDGILCHDGEVHNRQLRPKRHKTFEDFDNEVLGKSRDPLLSLRPMSLEGCVVRFADTISYIGRDIEDAIELKLIRRSEIPDRCGKRLGTSNGTIVYNLVTDLIESSRHIRSVNRDESAESDYICFSRDTAERLLELKEFNYKRIYKNPVFKPDFDRIRTCYETLFNFYYSQLDKQQTNDFKRFTFLRSMDERYLCKHGPVEITRDYIAGMTDDFFLRQAKELGCDIPKRKCLPN